MVKIITADDVTLEVPIYHLQSASGFFRDLFADRRARQGHQPLLIDAPRDVVTIFVAMISHNYQQVSNQHLTLTGIEALLDLGERYDCPVIKSTISHMLRLENAHLSGLDVFNIAGQMEDLPLAKIGLRNMPAPCRDAYEYLDLDRRRPEHINHRYIEGHMRAVIDSLVDGAHGGAGWGGDWGGGNSRRSAPTADDVADRCHPAGV